MIDPVDVHGLGRPLPARVRNRVVGLAADGLAAMAEEEVPAPLRAVRRFTPARRARLAAAPLATVLESDPAFRQRIAALVRDVMPELAASVDDGRPLPVADPVDVAAAAYLLRPPEWVRIVTSAGEQVERVEAADGSAQSLAAVSLLQEQLATVRVQARLGLDRLRAEVEAARAEAVDLRRRLRDAEGSVRRAEAAARQAASALDRARTDAAKAASLAEANERRLRQRLAATEASLDTARADVREGRSLTDARLRLLLDTVVDAAVGLRRELALPPARLRPADAVLPQAPGVADVGARAREVDDPAVLDHLLALPQAHLIVDGYNVTKTGYGTLALDAQRQRLVSGLSSLAARFGAEVTCCFDGAEVVRPVGMAAPRGVRVLFSRPGETADELIRRLVQAEPPGRPVTVVSSDREVAESALRAGARAVPAVVLLRRLERA